MRRLLSNRSVVVQPVRNGLGLVARRHLKPGDLVFRVGGRTLTSAALWRLWKTAPRRAANSYRCGEDLYAMAPGTVADYANHSCRPNSAVFVERSGLVVRAVRAIRLGQEVTHDYATLLGADDVWTMRCNCGERGCRKMVRRFDRLPAATLRRYVRAGWIPTFILLTAR